MRSSTIGPEIVEQLLAQVANILLEGEVITRWACIENSIERYTRKTRGAFSIDVAKVAFSNAGTDRALQRFPFAPVKIIDHLLAFNIAVSRCQEVGNQFGHPAYARCA